MTRGMGEDQYRRPAGWATSELRRRITEGVYAANAYLPPERDLAREIGVGRRALRLALDRLESDGFVERSRGRGTRVLPQSERLTTGAIGVVSPFAGLLLWSESIYILQGIRARLAQLGLPFQEVSAIQDDLADTIPSEHLIRYSEIEKLSRLYSGLIFVEASTRHVEAEAVRLEAAHYPIVVANLEVDIDVTATWVDHAKAMRQAVETLASFGHRRIAYVGRPRDGVLLPEDAGGLLARHGGGGPSGRWIDDRHLLRE